MPETASDRAGIQPVISLTANGGTRAEVRVGQPVEFAAIAETPPGAGSIVVAEWDFDTTSDPIPSDQRSMAEQFLSKGGSDRFPISEEFAPGARVTFARTHTFTKPGTYFPALRAYAHRDGDETTPYALIPNLGRVRVVVG